MSVLNRNRWWGGKLSVSGVVHLRKLCLPATVDFMSAACSMTVCVG